jgi:prefoldin subunit 5
LLDIKSDVIDTNTSIGNLESKINDTQQDIKNNYVAKEDYNVTNSSLESKINELVSKNEELNKYILVLEERLNKLENSKETGSSSI